ncbi:Uncharacterised protein [Vibrio cholerae]|nr:Uncharacterised protein [Vibrio cholerae]
MMWPKPNCLVMRRDLLTINKVIKGFLSKPMVALYFWMKLVK